MSNNHAQSDGMGSSQSYHDSQPNGNEDVLSNESITEQWLDDTEQSSAETVEIIIDSDDVYLENETDVATNDFVPQNAMHRSENVSPSNDNRVTCSEFDTSSSCSDKQLNGNESELSHESSSAQWPIDTEQSSAGTIEVFIYSDNVCLDNHLDVDTNVSVPQNATQRWKNRTTSVENRVSSGGIALSSPCSHDQSFGNEDELLNESFSIHPLVDAEETSNGTVDMDIDSDVVSHGDQIHIDLNTSEPQNETQREESGTKYGDNHITNGSISSPSLCTVNQSNGFEYELPRDSAVNLSTMNIGSDVVCHGNQIHVDSIVSETQNTTQRGENGTASGENRVSSGGIGEADKLLNESSSIHLLVDAEKSTTKKVDMNINSDVVHHGNQIHVESIVSEPQKATQRGKNGTTYDVNRISSGAIASTSSYNHNQSNRYGNILLRE